MNRTTRVLLTAVVVLATVATSWATVETDLQKAAADARPVFLIVTDGEAKGIDLARKVAGEAQKIVPEALVIELDRGDKANAAVVAKLRLASVAVPLILVVGPNGVPAGGAKPHLVTASKLARMVPSPAKAALLKALSEGKPAFLVFARTAMPSRVATLSACAAAVATLKGAAAVVAVDMDDAKEADFGVEMQVDPKAKDVVTVVVNAKGQRATSFLGVPTAQSLVDATVAKAGGCAPGSCGPGGCK